MIHDLISMAQHKIVVTPVLTHWSYHNLMLSHWWQSVYLRFYRGRSGQSFPGTIPLFLCSTTSCRIWRVTQILCIVCIIWQGFVIISSCWWEYVYSMFSHGYLHNNCNLLTPPARWWDGLPEFIRPDWISVKRDKILCQHWSYIIFCANSSWLS